MNLRIALTVAFLLLAWATWAVCGPHRDAYETAPYEVETPPEAKGAPEIRLYPALSLASTPLPRPGSPAENSGFGRLFAFISGANEEDQKIAMTTPVFMDGARMSFVLPQEIASSGPPKPSAANVVLDAFSAGRYVALRFSGGRGKGNAEGAEGRLRQWAEARNLDVVEPAIFAYYDPPFTLPAFRRNEVLLRMRD